MVRDSSSVVCCSAAYCYCHKQTKRLTQQLVLTAALRPWPRLQIWSWFVLSNIIFYIVKSTSSYCKQDLPIRRMNDMRLRSLPPFPSHHNHVSSRSDGNETKCYYSINHSPIWEAMRYAKHNNHRPSGHVIIYQIIVCCHPIGLLSASSGQQRSSTKQNIVTFDTFAWVK